MQKWLIGVDEAGRGPLAGPVSVGVVYVKKDFDWSLIEGVNDSKKLTELKREEIFKATKQLKKEGKMDFAVSMVSAKVIDEIGIVPAVNRAMAMAFSKLAPSPEDCEVKLDGSLSAPKEFLYQETIIKGDSKEKVIGLASIMAKVMRDRYMVRITNKREFVPYDFHIHKGYGTKSHRDNIAQHGLSIEHRVSYCKNIEVL